MWSKINVGICFFVWCWKLNAKLKMVNIYTYSDGTFYFENVFIRCRSIWSYCQAYALKSMKVITNYSRRLHTIFLYTLCFGKKSSHIRKHDMTQSMNKSTVTTDSTYLKRIFSLRLITQAIMHIERKYRASWTQRLKQGLSVSYAEFCHILTLHFIINGFFVWVYPIVKRSLVIRCFYASCSRQTFFYFIFEGLSFNRSVLFIILYFLLCAHSLFHSLLIHNLAYKKLTRLCEWGIAKNPKTWKAD